MHVVVNWLWQGVVLVVLADVAMRSAPRVSASTRYILWWVAMILVLLLPAMPTLVAVSGAPHVRAAAAPPLSPLPHAGCSGLAAPGCFRLLGGLDCRVSRPAVRVHREPRARAPGRDVISAWAGRAARTLARGPAVELAGPHGSFCPAA